jgi:hypothetical protein
MADSPMMMERFLLWWQRNLAVAYVLAGSVVFGVVALFWYAEGPVTMAGLWGLAHGHTATYHAMAVKLPPGWREEDGVSQADLHLDKPYEWREKIETVDVDEFTGKDVDFGRRMNTLRSLEQMATRDGDVSAVYPLSDVNAARFVCMEHGAPDHTTLHVTCLSRDGRRVVRMAGSEDTRADFAAILTALAGVR